MDLSTISAFFGDTVPIGVVFLIAHQIYLANEMRHIRKDLSNHITDTNKKIEQLGYRIDKQGEHIDKLSDRFDRLYELLIQDRKQKQAKQ